MPAALPDPVLEFADAAAWEHWLEQHHAESPEAWLRIGRKHSELPLLDILDAAMVGHCFGWIDGQRRALDDDSFLQRYSPRRPRSSWSQVNVERVEELIAAGRMRPAGLAEVERARADGRWERAYERQSTAEPPADLLTALAAHPSAAATFDALGRTERYAVILAILKADGPEARQRTIDRQISRLGDAGQRG